MESSLLILLLIVPLVGAVVCALLPGGGAAKSFALVVSLITAVIGIALAGQFEWHGTGEMLWGYGDSNPFSIQGVKFAVRLGTDSVSLWLVLLTVFLMPL